MSVSQTSDLLQLQVVNENNVLALTTRVDHSWIAIYDSFTTHRSPFMINWRLTGCHFWFIEDSWIAIYDSFQIHGSPFMIHSRLIGCHWWFIEDSWIAIYDSFQIHGSPFMIYSRLIGRHLWLVHNSWISIHDSYHAMLSIIPWSWHGIQESRMIIDDILDCMLLIKYNREI